MAGSSVSHGLHSLWSETCLLENRSPFTTNSDQLTFPNNASSDTQFFLVEIAGTGAGTGMVTLTPGVASLTPNFEGSYRSQYFMNVGQSVAASFTASTSGFTAFTGSVQVWQLVNGQTGED